MEDVALTLADGSTICWSDRTQRDAIMQSELTYIDH
jgi:hypothetical protein